MSESAHIPHEYLCPITQEMMEDPVIAADGNTYERAAITSWLNRSKTSPVTEKDFKHKNLSDNYFLRYEISQFNKKNQPVSSLNQAEDPNKLLSSLQNLYINKKSYVGKLRTSIIYLANIKEDLESHLLGCKISNTVGISASMAGTGLMFTPLALLGILTMIAGSLTSVGTTVTQYFIEKKQLKKMKKILIDEEKAAVRYEVSMLKAKNLVEASNLAMQSYHIGSRIWKMVKEYRTLSALKALKSTKSIFSLKGGWPSIMAAGKNAKFLKASAIGAGLSAIDIVATWAVENSTLEEIKKQIENREKTIEKEVKEVQEIEKALVQDREN
ncbi:unnamed protein product [Blepharisma stoltei]|uniref:U-box domain-containing protein n=1 Tax=Blepharisma stoltei TaxID=1481888 RepID=A0AAU9J0I8_9CILI|nr:unnamed protein product [Blepharisma stoltei]